MEQYTATRQNRDGIWNILGHESIMSRIKEGIKKAKHRILLEIWEEDALELKEDLQKASRNGVEILIVAYGEIDFDFAKVYCHDMSEQITSEYGGRWVVFSADDREVVAGIISLGSESRAAWTMHTGLVMPITEVIIHDMYIMEILREFRGQLEEKFGPDLSDLRKKFMIEPLGKKYYRP